MVSFESSGHGPPALLIFYHAAYRADNTTSWHGDNAGVFTVKVPAWVFPVGLAVVLTLLNTAKPVVMDDTAYLQFARQIAVHPLDPYGGELFWYREPEPTMTILLPPVLPYWFALGIAIFGENLFLLKLWLLPFGLGLCFAVQFLLKRFGRGNSAGMLVMFILGPAVLPLFNFMLDIPALALGASAIALFIRGADRTSTLNLILAGVLAGLAMQTKYTMFVVPVILLGYGIHNRSIPQAIISTILSLIVFESWELFLHYRYGESHFLHHVRQQQTTGEELSFGTKLSLKAALFQPMLGHLGLLALALGLAVGRAVGYSRWMVIGFAALSMAGITAVCLLSYSDSVILRNSTNGSAKLDLPTAVFGFLGFAAFTSMIVATMRPLLRAPKWRLRWSMDAWFLAGWFAVEILAYFALTPFPAARRVVPMCLPMPIIAHRFIALRSVHRPTIKLTKWVVAFSVVLGLGLHALDCWDARAERDLAIRAAEVTKTDGSSTTYYQGHWGWQYYCDRAGMKPLFPDKTELKPGDFLVMAELPDETGFYRPYHGGATFELEDSVIEKVARFVWNDDLAAQTIPNLYGGKVPIRGRDHARLCVVVYRIRSLWKPKLRR